MSLIGLLVLPCELSLVGMNNNRSSIIASHYFLLCRHSKIALMYNCQMGGEIFSPIGIFWYRYDMLPKYIKIPQYLFDFSESLREWNVSLSLVLIVPHI